MNLFIPILYICLNGQCGFLQQVAVYENEEFCKQVVKEKAEGYKKTYNAKIDATCISVPAEIKKVIKGKSNERQL